MYETIKTVILSGRYELPDMFGRIGIIRRQRDISDAEKDKLIPAEEYPCWIQPMEPIMSMTPGKIACLESLKDGCV